MGKMKKVVLFVVEGSTDETALQPILKKLLQNDKVKFDVLHRDITSDIKCNTKNIKGKIGKEINEYLDVSKLKKKDIKEIVHLIDTDGSFVTADAIEEKEQGEIEYTEEKIIVKNKVFIEQRNQRKTEVVKLLFSTKKILGNIPYTIYYFSRNREHVFNNVTENLSSNEKWELAEEFSDKYENDIEGFCELMCNSSFAKGREYKESWEFILDGNNSLKRYCNFHIFLKDLHFVSSKLLNIENNL